MAGSTNGGRTIRRAATILAAIVAASGVAACGSSSSPSKHAGGQGSSSTGTHPVTSSTSIATATTTSANTITPNRALAIVANTIVHGESWVTYTMQAAAADYLDSEHDGEGDGTAACISRTANTANEQSPGFFCYLTDDINPPATAYFYINGPGTLVGPITAAQFKTSTGELPAEATTSTVPCTTAERLAMECSSSGQATVTGPAAADSTTTEPGTTTSTSGAPSGGAGSTTACGTIIGGPDNFSGQTLSITSSGTSCVTARQVITALGHAPEQKDSEGLAGAYQVADGWKCAGGMGSVRCTKGTAQINEETSG